MSSPSSESAAFRSALDVVRSVEPGVADAITAELASQRASLKLIASENYASPAVLLAMGNWLSDKYAEGTIGRRFYAGCAQVDTIETIGAGHARELFGAPHAYLQPPSGIDANLVAYWAILARRIESPALERAGTQQVNDLSEEDWVLVAGYSAYPRRVNFAVLREIADEVGATFMVDMAHIAGLVAGGVHPSPFPHAHVVTTTTHKSLRGPRGGMVLCQPELAEAVDRGCPLVLGGPLPNVMAAKAVALAEARQPSFREYAGRIVANARALSDGLIRRGTRLVTGGTDNHLVLIDVGGYGLTGRQAEQALLDAGIVTNRNAIPRDPNGAWCTSGIRIGTPALTTRGLGTAEMDVIAGLMHEVLSQARPGTTSSGAPSRATCAADPALADRVAKQATELLAQFPLYPSVDLG